MPVDEFMNNAFRHLSKRKSFQLYCTHSPIEQTPRPVSFSVSAWEAPMRQSAISFPEIIVQRSQQQPEAIAYRFFQGPAFSAETLAFYALWERSAGLAYLMQERGLSNQHVLLVCKSQRNFVIALFACLLAGAVAVPTAPPRRQSLLARLQLIVRDSQAQAIIFDDDQLEQVNFDSVGRQLPKWDMRSLWERQNLPMLAARWTPSFPTGETKALLQYTSGSTGDPKGVVITHSNLMHNCAAIRAGMAISETSSSLLALPLFHDMGLVGVLQSMYSGYTTSFLSPAEFVQYPERWLQIISRFRISISGGPNFMYQLAAQAIKSEEVQDLDLSAWHVAFCGAEPIRSATISKFAKQFEIIGFRPNAFYPCYGLAESTLFITGSQVGTVPTVSSRDGMPIVSCGTPRHDTRIEIVDPDTLTRLPEGCIGEIWVNGSSVAQGYWMRPELTKHTFQASLSGEGAVYFLRTGDLGYLRDGELYVSGRIKDLIIVNGKKYVPQDIEQEAERSHSALCQAGGAAFGVTKDNLERLVIVSEMKRGWLRRHEEWPGIVSAIRSAVNTTYGIIADDIVLIKPGTLPRTSSGKVRRNQSRLEHLAGTLARPRPIMGK